MMKTAEIDGRLLLPPLPPGHIVISDVVSFGEAPGAINLAILVVIVTRLGICLAILQHADLHRASPVRMRLIVELDHMILNKRFMRFGADTGRIKFP